jgi:hypothetical protein
MDKRFPPEQECLRTSRHFNELLPTAFAYADRKKLTTLPFRRFTLLEERWLEYPEGWGEQVLGMLAGQALFGSAKRTAAFLRSARDELSPPQIELVKEWREYPWFFTAFTVREDAGDNFLIISPVGDPPAFSPYYDMWDEIPVYSRTITNLHRQGKTLFISQLWKGKGVFETYGVILPFTALNPDDIRSFTHMVSLNGDTREMPLIGINESGNEVSDTMASQPLEYLQLLPITEVPNLRGPGGRRMESCASVLPLPEGFDGEFEEHGEGGRLILAEEGALSSTSLYLSKPEGLLFLFSWSREGYDRGRAMLLPDLPFPEKPDKQIFVGLEAQADSILDTRERLHALMSLFDRAAGDSPPDEDEENALGDINMIMSRLQDNHNNGIVEDDEAIAEELDVDPETVRDLREQLAAAFKRMEAASGHSPADRFGLSPKAFQNLTSVALPDAAGFLALRSPADLSKELAAQGLDEETLLKEAPAVRLAAFLLGLAAGHQGLAATAAGYVSPKVIKQVLQEEIFPSYGSAPAREIDWRPFMDIRKILERASLLRLEGNSFRAAGRARKLADNPVGLYSFLIREYFISFDWTDSPYLPLPFIRPFAGFLLYALKKLSPDTAGGWVPAGELNKKVMAALPGIDDSKTLEELTDIAVSGSFLGSFATPLGLVELKQGKYGIAEGVRPSELFPLVFA